jgi:hypothetical protein
MVFAEPEPWAPAAIARLDVRPGDRALACCVSLATARALAAAVTRDGSLVVVGEPRTAHQLANLRLPQLQAFASPLRDSARFGVFDALLVCANTAPDLPADVWADLARANLRPGGRAVFDLPAPNAVPGLAAAAAAAGWPAERLAALAGVDDGALATALGRAGLRDVQRELASDLLRADSPGDAVAVFARSLGLDDAAAADLTAGLVRAQGTTGPVELLVHRTRVRARR